MLAGLGRLGVQGVERADRELLDAAALVGHLVPEGSMFWFLATHRGEVFPDAEFADLFPSGRGRPSLPAPVAASILTLQTLHDLSDAETAEAARCDLRWKVAVGMALDDGGFHPSTLTYWRQRLARSARPHRINEAVKRVVEETGIVAGRRRRAVDSTILADAVATQDTIIQLVAAIRRVAREVPGAAAQIAVVCTGHDYSTPGKPQIDWDDPRQGTRWCRRWSTTQARCLRRWTTPSWTSRPRRRWRCWRWWQAKTWSLPRARTGPMGAGGSPARSPPTGSSPPSTPMPATPASRRRAAGTATGRTWPPSPRTPPPAASTPPRTMTAPPSGMAIRPTAPGTCATPSPRPGTWRWSS